MQADLLQGLETVRQLAKGSKWQRCWHHPFSYLFAILHRSIHYRIFKQPYSTKALTFFGSNMQLALPAATDIFLTGGKTHASEISLAAFLIRQLKPGDVFFDVGAHYGYFSLLGAKLVGTDGQVVAFEPADQAFAKLQANMHQLPHVFCQQVVVGNSEQEVDFFEFDTLFNEFNSMNAAQYAQADWMKTSDCSKTKKQSLRLDSVVAKGFRMPNVVKLDVEGAEWDVLLGCREKLILAGAVFVMEYVLDERGNEQHRKAIDLLQQNGYLLYQLDEQGMALPITGWQELTQNGMSINLVASKHGI
jgi:FkbM family methyltransferase